MVVIKEKISKINEVNNIDSRINELISENKYNEAINLINLKLKDTNAENIYDTEIIGKVGYTVNEKTGEIKQEDLLVQ